MALNLKSIKKNSGGGNTRSFGKWNIPVMIGAVHVADPKNRNIEEDYAEAYILAPFDDVVPQFADDGAPLTSFKLKMNPKKAVKNRPEVFELQKGKRVGISQPTGEFPIIVLEKAYLDRRSETLVADWYTFAKRSYDNPNEACVTGAFVSVDPYKENNGNVKQNRYAVFPDQAVTFSGLDDFKAKGAAFLQHNPELGGGRPCFWVRIVDNDSVTDPERESEIVMTSVYLSRDEDGNELSAEQSIEKWLAAADEDEDRASWVEYIAASGSEAGYTFELIPFYSYSTGSKTIEAKQGKSQDDSVVFQIQEGDRKTSGFGPGTIVAKRTGEDQNAFFATATFLSNIYSPRYPREEIPTDNLPEPVRKALMDKAQAASQKRISDAQSRYSQQGGVSDEAHDGEPDHSAGQSRGLTPN